MGAEALDQGAKAELGSAFKSDLSDLCYSSYNLTELSFSHVYSESTGLKGLSHSKTLCLFDMGQGLSQFSLLALGQSSLYSR